MPRAHMVDDRKVFFHGPDRVMVIGANPRLADGPALGAGPGVQVRDCGADFAHVSVQGPKSRALLQELAGDDLSNTALRYHDFRDGVVIAGIPMQISRLGFTGELGSELLLPVARTPDLWRALTKAGQKHGPRSIGGSFRRTRGY